MINNRNELAALISNRDGISLNEAYDLIELVDKEINEAILDMCTYDEICEILEYYLGLEPDYLDLFI